MSEAGVNRFIMYAEVWPMNILCTNKHSLYMLCNWHIVTHAVQVLYGQVACMSRTVHIATCKTLCNGAVSMPANQCQNSVAAVTLDATK